MFLKMQVNENTRRMVFEDSKSTAGIVGDSNVDGVVFYLPEDSEYFEFRNAVVYVIFFDATNKSHMQLLDQVDDYSGMPKWTFDDNVLKNDATSRVPFFLHMVISDTSGTVLKSWNTLPSTVIVYKNRDYDNQEEEATRETDIDRLAGLVVTLTEKAETIGNVEKVLSQITGSAPKPVDTRAKMIDDGHIYLYTGDETSFTTGAMYYYVDGTLTYGGIYGSYDLDTTLTESGKAADAGAVGAAIDEVKEDLLTVSADITPLVLTVDAINDNPNTVLLADGSYAATASAIGVSNAYSCKSGETLTYKLSTQNNNLLLAVYDASDNLTYSVAGTGYSGYIEGTYTFTDSDAYFRISGVTGNAYMSNYSINYSYLLPNIATKSEMDAVEVEVAYFEQTEVKSLLTNGGGIRTDGTINSGAPVVAAYIHSDYIPLKKGSVIAYSGVRVTNLCAIAPYSTSKVFDSTNAVIARTTISGTWTMPYDGYVRLCCRNTELSGDASFVISNPTKAAIDALDARVDVLEDALSDTWTTYLSTKETEIKAALVDIGDTGEAFTFVTDCHVARNNMLTPRILRALGKSCPVNYHINGGDFIDINTDSAQSAIDVLWTWKDAMYGMTEYCVRGNHDTNNYNGENDDYALTVGQFYAVMDRQIENIVDTDGKTYYCIDNDSQKIRIIVLDSSLSGKTAMYSWLSTKLTELDSTWTILVIQHYLWGSTTDSIHANGTATINAINAVYSEINATFIGILAGHTHVDYNETESVNGYLLIARDTNMISGGTDTTALSFDYVTINTDAKTINFIKVGRGDNLTLTY